MDKLNSKERNMLAYCNLYKLGGTPIRDWLICGHVASDKCNVSRRATRKQLLPAPYIQNQNGGFELASL